MNDELMTANCKRLLSLPTAAAAIEGALDSETAFVEHVGVDHGGADVFHPVR